MNKNALRIQSRSRESHHRSLSAHSPASTQPETGHQTPHRTQKSYTQTIMTTLCVNKHNRVLTSPINGFLIFSAGAVDEITS